MELFAQTNPYYWELDHDGGKFFSAHLIESLSNSETTIVVAEDRKEILGFTLAYVESLPEWFGSRRIGFIRYMGVSAEVRDKKIGTMMFEFVISRFREQKINRVELYVLSGLPAAAFWQKLGFSTFMERRFLEI